MAALLEHDVKSLLRDNGVPVPDGALCLTPEDAFRVAGECGPDVVIKALIPAKGKQQAGGIAFAASPQEARMKAQELLGTRVGGFPVECLLVERREKITTELYVSVTLDGGAKYYSVIVSKEGGTGVEAALGKSAFHSIQFHPDQPPPPERIRTALEEMRLQGDAAHKAALAINSLCKIAVGSDSTLLEVNPLAVLECEACSALGTLMTIDESALYRQERLKNQVVLHVDQFQRPLTAWESEVDAINSQLPQGGAIRFGEFPEGDIGVFVFGGGAGLVVLDAIARLGGRPANFFDMTSSTRDVEEKCYLVMKSFLSQPHLKGLFIGSNIAAFLPVPMRFSGIARALTEFFHSGNRLPVVIRLPGIDDDVAYDLLGGLPIPYFRDERTLEDAVSDLMQRIRGNQ
jgi:succinyl-CoA synthetase beta subunit